MAITDWPESERPREKLLAQGASSLTDAELLAIFLRTGVAGKTAVDLARDLIRQFSGLRPLLEADCKSFCSAKGLGKAKFVHLQACLEMARRHMQAQLHKDCALTSPSLTQHYLQSRLRGHQQEVFAGLFLDAQNRVICFEELFYGTIDGASVHPREVIKRALKHNAAGIIFAHNHPSGIANPSQADLQITRLLRRALDLIDVRLLDHIVIGDSRVASMAELGMI